MKARHEEIKVKLDFSVMPEKHTCLGEGTSPKIGLSGLSYPYLALLIDDPDAPGGSFTHWIVWNIEATDAIPADIPKDARPRGLPGAVQGTNSAMELGYYPPCPPRGQAHHYHFKVYGLEAPLDLPPGAGRKEFDKAVRDHARQHGEFVATFMR